MKENEIFGKRDAIGISETNSIQIKSKRTSELHFIEQPRQF